MSPTFFALISWTAVGAGTLSMWAQFRRVTTQGIDGVSLATWLMFSLLSGFWMAYGDLSAHSLAIFAGSALAWPLQWFIVVRLKPWRRRRGSSQALALFVATCMVPGLVGGWAWCVYGSGVAMTLLRVPQFVHLMRSRDTSGVSSASWFISAATATLWIVYYAHAHLGAALVASGFSGTASVVIGTLAVRRHRQEQVDLVGAEAFAN